ncbi:MAG: extracellular catalytic domain type 1 short-chain-length polyhydroxyalkanoate depolymerase [Nitriliruptorales bacterium]
MGTIRLALVVVLTALSLGAAPPSDRGEAPSELQRWQGRFLRFEADDPTTGRDYWLYVPGRLDRNRGRGPTLVVYLHGCNQDAVEAAIGTRWNALAEREGFLVVYPDQHDPNTDPPEDQLGHHVGGVGNGARCWNWFRPEHQTRESGEPAMIADITRRVMDRYRVDPDRVYLLGLSAGGIMAGVMGATYPDLYAAIGIFAGCAYPDCADVTGLAAADAMGKHARPLPVMVLQGTADTLVVAPAGLTPVPQWLGTADKVDDGVVNGSVPRTPASTEHRGLDPSLLDGLGTVGDLCVRNRNFPCLGGPLGEGATYPTSVQTYVDARGCSLVELWLVHGLGHGYPGGDPEGTFTDPHGPDGTAGAWDFFTRHPRTWRETC